MIKLSLDGRSPDVEGVTPFGKIHEIEVHVQNFVMSMKHLKMTEEALENSPENEDEHLKIARFILYPALSSCSTGDVPTEKEFLLLPKRAVNKWYEVAVELNPDLIELDDGLTDDEELKKNKK